MKKQLPLVLVVLSAILFGGGHKASAQTLYFDPLGASSGTPNATGSFGSGTYYWDDGGTFEAPVAGATIDWSNGTTDQAYIDGNNGVVFGGVNASDATATVSLVDPVYPGTAAGNTASITFNTSGYDIVPVSATDNITFEDQNAITVATGVTAEVDALLSTDLADSYVDGNGNTQYPNAHDISITGNTDSTLILRGGIDYSIQTSGKSISFGGGGTLDIDGAVGVTTDSANNVLYHAGNLFAGSGTIVLNTGASITGGDKAGFAFGQGDDVPGGTGVFTQNGGVSNFYNGEEGQGNSYTVNVNGGVFSSNSYDLGSGNQGATTLLTDVLNISGGAFQANSNFNILTDDGTGTQGGPQDTAATVNITGGVADFVGGIAIGNSIGTVFAGNSASINISGGTTFIGANSSGVGIGSGGSVSAANTSIVLSGGTVAALSDWTSSENMTLSNTNGGVTFQTSDVGSTIAGNQGGTTNFGYTASGEAYKITLSGILSGNGSLTASGGGILLTSGANTYTGGTSVTGGTQLELASAGTGNVHVGGANSVLQLDMNTAIAATATLTLDTANASDVDLNFLTAGTTDIIGGLVIDGQALAAGVYTVNYLDSLTINGVAVDDFSDNAGGLNSLTVAPEPSTWALMLGGLGLVGLVVRRRHAVNQI